MGTTDWLATINKIELALRNSVQNSTGLSISFLVYEQSIKMPVYMLDGVQGEGSGAIMHMQAT